MQRPWQAVDAWGSAGGRPHALDDVATPAPAAEWLDRAIARVKSRNVLHPWAFYSGGWGATHLLPTFAHQLTATAAVAAVADGGAAGEMQAILADGSDAARDDVELPPHIAALLASGKISRGTAAAATRIATIPVVQPHLHLTPLGGGAPERSRARRAWVLQGAFPSPVIVPPLGLPPVASHAAFQLVLPPSPPPSPPSPPSPPVPLVILLPGTGEQGFDRRRHCLAYPLAAAGIATLILEGPYYGSRKPPAQVGSKLATLVDLCVLGRTTIEEGRALAAWAARLPRAALDAACAGDGTPHTHQPATTGGTPPPAFSCTLYAGTSMGGLHAAMAASLTPWPVGVVSWLGPPSAAPVFTVGALADAVAWDTLTLQAGTASAVHHDVDAMERILRYAVPAAEEAPHVRDVERHVAHVAHGHHADRAGATLAVRTLAARLLRVTDLINFVPPARPDAAFLIYAAHDRYIPAGGGTAVAAMWQRIAARWRGATVRTIRGGHVSGSIFALEPYLQTILQCVAKLRDGTPPCPPPPPA